MDYSASRAGTGGESDTVSLRDGCEIFGNTSGRANGLVMRNTRQLLSRYKDIKICNHYIDCPPTQSLEADWNNFNAPDYSPVARFTFDEGWV